MAPWIRCSLFVAACAVSAAPASARSRGLVGTKAPAVWAQSWRNLPPGERSFDVPGQRGKVIVLFFFQSWCPGCHRRGFPALAAAVKHYAGAPDVAFAAIQTVFEGALVNTAPKAWSSVAEYGLSVAVGHDPGPDGARSLTMTRYRSGGTPWFVVIDRGGVVRFDGFHLPGPKLIEHVRRLRFEPGPMSLER